MLGEDPARNRVAWLARTQRLTRFVGRAAEVELLAASLEQLAHGPGQVLALCGEAGIGKSRLLWELIHDAAWPYTLLEARCEPEFQNTGLHPWRRVLEQLLGILPADTPDQRRVRLAQTLAQFDLAEPATGWLLASFLDLAADAPAPETLTEAQRERIRGACLALLRRRAAGQPLMFVLEDLHWADPSTIAWLDASLDALAATRCLTLLTYRPTFTPPWRPRPGLRQITLGPLSTAEAALMLAELPQAAALSAEQRRQVTTQADGIPLFIEELARALHAGGGAPGETIPSTLRDVLAARLDQVGKARVTAGWAAALGRECAYPVLAASVPYGAARLQADLAALVAAGLLEPTPGRGPAATEPAGHVFRHALIREAVCAGLLKRTRQAHHRRIAEVYLASFPALAQAQPEVVAEHFQQAGLAERAAEY